MLKSFKNFTIFTDQDIPVVTLDEKDYSVKFIINPGNFYVK